MHSIRFLLFSGLVAMFSILGCGGADTETPTGSSSSSGAGGTAPTSSASSTSSSTSTGTPAPVDVAFGKACDMVGTPIAPFFHDAFAPDPALDQTHALAALRVPSPASIGGKVAVTEWTYLVYAENGSTFCGRVDHRALVYVVGKDGTPDAHPKVVRTVDVKQADLVWKANAALGGDVAQVTIALDPPVVSDAATEALLVAPEYAITDTHHRLCPMACDDGPDMASFFSIIRPDWTIATCPDESCDLVLLSVSPSAAKAAMNGNTTRRWIGTGIGHATE